MIIKFDDEKPGFANASNQMNFFRLAENRNLEL